MAVEADLEREAAVHRKGYESFIRVFKVGAVISFILAMIVVVIIAK